MIYRYTVCYIFLTKNVEVRLTARLYMPVRFLEQIRHFGTFCSISRTEGVAFTAWAKRIYRIYEVNISHGISHISRPLGHIACEQREAIIITFPLSRTVNKMCCLCLITTPPPPYGGPPLALLWYPKFSAVVPLLPLKFLTTATQHSRFIVHRTRSNIAPT